MEVFNLEHINDLPKLMKEVMDSILPNNGRIDTAYYGHVNGTHGCKLFVGDPDDAKALIVYSRAVRDSLGTKQAWLDNQWAIEGYACNIRNEFNKKRRCREYHREYTEAE